MDQRVICGSASPTTYGDVVRAARIRRREAVESRRAVESMREEPS